MLVLLDEVATSLRTAGLKAICRGMFPGGINLPGIYLVPSPFLTGRWNMKLPEMSGSLGPHGYLGQTP